MSKPHHELIVLMPVYEDRDSATELLRRIAACCPVRPYVLAIEDGSLRQPLSARAIADAGLAGEIVHLTRNMGHQRAIATGLVYVALHFDADTVVVMDCDGEDRPETMAPLIEQLRSGNIDAVVARRRKRSEAFSFRAFYVFYKLIFKFFTGRTISFGNFVALSMPAVRRLAAMQELWVHFAASLMIARLRIGGVDTDRGKRYAGASSMNFVSLSLHGLRSLMVFAEDVLVRVGIFCTLMATIALGLLLTAVGLKIAGFATPGWFTAAAGILIVILMQAGVLTFTTLMLSGVVRGSAPISRAQLEMLILRIEKAEPAGVTPQLAPLA